MQTETISLWQAVTSPVCARRAVKVAAVVGTLLVLLNHGDNILAGAWPPWWKIVLTYTVPYCVSSYSTAMFMIQVGRTGSIAKESDDV